MCHIYRGSPLVLASDKHSALETNNNWNPVFFYVNYTIINKSFTVSHTSGLDVQVLGGGIKAEIPPSHTYVRLSKVLPPLRLTSP